MDKKNFISTISNCTKEQLNYIIRENGKKRKPFNPIVYHYKIKSINNNKKDN